MEIFSEMMMRELAQGSLGSRDQVVSPLRERHAESSRVQMEGVSNSNCWQKRDMPIPGRVTEGGVCIYHCIYQLLISFLLSIGLPDRTK